MPRKNIIHVALYQNVSLEKTPLLDLLLNPLLDPLLDPLSTWVASTNKVVFSLAYYFCVCLQLKWDIISQSSGSHQAVIRQS